MPFTWVKEAQSDLEHRKKDMKKKKKKKYKVIATIMYCEKMQYQQALQFVVNGIELDSNGIIGNWTLCEFVAVDWVWDDAWKRIFANFYLYVRVLLLILWNITKIWSNSSYHIQNSAQKFVLFKRNITKLSSISLFSLKKLCPLWNFSFLFPSLRSELTFLAMKRISRRISRRWNGITTEKSMNEINEHPAHSIKLILCNGKLIISYRLTR